MNLTQKTRLNSGHRFCGMEFEHINAINTILLPHQQLRSQCPSLELHPFFFTLHNSLEAPLPAVSVLFLRDL